MDLTIDRSLDIPPGRRRVVVLIDEAAAEQSSGDWPSFVKATYRSLADIPIEREPEGAFEIRAEIE